MIFVSNRHFPALCYGDGSTSASSCLSSREPDPAFDHTVFLDIEVLLTVEKYMNTACKICGIEKLACRICAKPVGGCWVCHLALQSEGS
jgi:hypothetical protein